MRLGAIIRPPPPMRLAWANEGASMDATASAITARAMMEVLREAVLGMNVSRNGQRK